MVLSYVYLLILLSKSALAVEFSPAISLKDDSVSLTNLQPQMVIAITVAAFIYFEEGKELVITSGNDGIHSRTSLHYSGNAVDFRTRHMTPEQAKRVARKIQNALKKDYDVVLEPTHLHIEYQPKRRKLNKNIPRTIYPQKTVFSINIPSWLSLADDWGAEAGCYIGVYTMTNIIPFSFESNEIRTVIIDDEPWFVAKDVAEALGYNNTNKAITDHCKRTASVGRGNDSLPLDPQTKIIQQPDVLRLISRSKLPAAERFDNWLFEEVIPAIMNTGSYQIQEERSESKPIDHKEVITVMTDYLSLYQACGLPKNQAVLSANEMVINRFEFDMLAVGNAYPYFLVDNPAKKPTADTSASNVSLFPTQNIADRNIEASENMTNAKSKFVRLTDIAIHFGMAPRDLNILLKAEGYQTKMNNFWMPTEKGKPWAKVFTAKKRDGAAYQYTKWLPSFKDELSNIINIA